MKDLMENSTRFSLETYLNRNATQGERSYSVYRLVVCTLFLVQLLFFRPLPRLLAEGSPKYWLITVGLLVPIIWSVLTLVLLKPSHQGLVLRPLSISVDVICATLVLLPTTLWPSAASYRGFLARPDAIIYIVMFICISLRLSRQGIAIGGLLTLLCTGFIVYMDFRINTHLLAYGAREIVIYAICALGTTILSFIFMRRILALIKDGAQTMAAYTVQKEYLQQVEHVIQAAAEVEAGALVPGRLDEVSRRTDALGRLARVFQSMANEVHAREQRLVQQVHTLCIEIDEVKKSRQLAEITETDYFRKLQEKTQQRRSQKGPGREPGEPSPHS